MGDPIERQDAINEALKCRVIEVTPAHMLIDKTEMVTKLLALPSVQPEPCEDAVSRADVLECFADLYDTLEDCSKGIINELHRKFEDLRTLPSVTPKRKTGKWIDQKGGGCCCSECGRYALDEVDGDFIHVAAKSNFCPNCGTKMEVESHDNRENRL